MAREFADSFMTEKVIECIMTFKWSPLVVPKSAVGKAFPVDRLHLSRFGRNQGTKLLDITLKLNHAPFPIIWFELAPHIQEHWCIDEFLYDEYCLVMLEDVQDTRDRDCGVFGDEFACDRFGKAYASAVLYNMAFGR